MKDQLRQLPAFGFRGLKGFFEASRKPPLVPCFAAPPKKIQAKHDDRGKPENHTEGGDVDHREFLSSAGFSLEYFDSAREGIGLSIHSVGRAA